MSPREVWDGTGVVDGILLGILPARQLLPLEYVGADFCKPQTNVKVLTLKIYNI